MKYLIIVLLIVGCNGSPKKGLSETPPLLVPFDYAKAVEELNAFEVEQSNWLDSQANVNSDPGVKAAYLDAHLHIIKMMPIWLDKISAEAKKEEEIYKMQIQ